MNNIWQLTVQEYREMRQHDKILLTFSSDKFPEGIKDTYLHQCYNRIDLVQRWINSRPQLKADNEYNQQRLKKLEKVKEWVRLAVKFKAVATEFLPEFESLSKEEISKILRQAKCILAKKDKPISKEKSTTKLKKYWENFLANWEYEGKELRFDSYCAIACRLEIDIHSIRHEFLLADELLCKFMSAWDKKDKTAFQGILDEMRIASQDKERYKFDAWQEKFINKGVKCWQNWWAFVTVKFTTADVFKVLSLFGLKSLPQPYQSWITKKVNPSSTAEWKKYSCNRFQEENFDWDNWHKQWYEEKKRSFENQLYLLRAKTCFSVLGVSPKATKDEVKKAYYSLCRRYHPDVNSEPNAEEKMKEINLAWDNYKLLYP